VKGEPPLESALREVANKMLDGSKNLDPDDARVLYENLDELYLK
jgi:hypothetical protein